MTDSCFIDYWEAAELAAAVLGIEEPCDDKATEATEDQFIEAFGIDLNTFAEIARRLVPLCAMDKSPLTGVCRKGFVRDGAYIVKILYEPIDDPMDNLRQASADVSGVDHPEGPTRDEAVAIYTEVMAAHDCQTLGDMAEHFARAVLARWGNTTSPTTPND